MWCIYSPCSIIHNPLWQSRFSAFYPIGNLSCLYILQIYKTLRYVIRVSHYYSNLEAFDYRWNIFRQCIKDNDSFSTITSHWIGWCTKYSDPQTKNHIQRCGSLTSVSIEKMQPWKFTHCTPQEYSKEGSFAPLCTLWVQIEPIKMTLRMFCGCTEWNSRLTWYVLAMQIFLHH